MLVTSKEMFEKAREGGYAIPAPNFIDLESLRWHVETAEKLNVPLILPLAEAHIGENITLEDAALVGKKYAAAAKVPVALHLDHGTDPEIIKKAVDMGFTSVMIDASMESFEENVRRTKEIIAYAHARGAVVEAEIGHVGAGENYENHDESDSQYTTVKEARRFVEETGVDSLAISIGTAHGMYKGIPEINFDRLKEIAGAIDTPLVLHGGSSSGDENLNKCAVNGISKINIFSDLLAAAMKSLEEAPPKTYLDVKALSKKGMQDCLEHYYSVFETKPID
ncbi:class II fructose-bisphosphate aldolase [Eubacterium maltosivorans]|uniref:Class II fructose-bisphosphate aldolase n=1 Tax=Eubacterium maltosivorans TaxID=2041044 RepID=A0A4P9C9S9_EUBML|nr:class II fructose-bisphosphate aldolase [Eubacterium maltosivorans]QCT72173.1 class II fructose-bisphosphate aldolase [Eubacterium maltosivorans]